MSMQASNTVLMVRPVQFRMNEQTALDNHYQQFDPTLTPDTANVKAQGEFDNFVTELRNIGVNVVVINDTLDTDTPDSIFPNNWVSFHSNGTSILYPMYTQNRRLERRNDVYDILKEQGFGVDKIVDYSSYENENLFLEGTGSMIIDNANKKIYVALSARATPQLVTKFASEQGYEPIMFKAYQDATINGNINRSLIYHTNVMMSIATTFAIICTDCIDDEDERNNVITNLKKDGKEIISLSEDQINQFAGNMLQVQGNDNKLYLVMSTQAFKSLQPEQITQIEKHCAILHIPLYTIETCGGGSARCMMAEVFLPKALE